MDTVSENKGMPEAGLLLADAGGSKTDWAEGFNGTYAIFIKIDGTLYQTGTSVTF